MTIAKYAGSCSCGRAFAAGAEVTFRNGTDGKWTVTSCPACAGGRGRTAVADLVTLRVRVETVRSSRPGWSVLAVAREASPEPVAVECPSNKFAVVAVQDLGRMGAGDVLDVTGSFTHHPQWGWQFKAEVVTSAIAASDGAVKAFLQRFPQIGPRRAEEILRHFGGHEATLVVLDEAPARLTEIKGISAERAAEIGSTYAAESMSRETLMFLLGLDLPDRVREWVIDEWGGDAEAIIKDDPYLLMGAPRVGLALADRVAQALGVQPTDPRRLAAVVLHLLGEAEREGHTWSSVEDLATLT